MGQRKFDFVKVTLEPDDYEKVNKNVPFACLDGSGRPRLFADSTVFFRKGGVQNGLRYVSHNISRGKPRNISNTAARGSPHRLRLERSR